MGSASSFTLEELLPSLDVASAADFDDEAAFDSYKVKLTENRFFKLPHLTITNIRIHSNDENAREMMRRVATATCCLHLDIA